MSTKKKKSKSKSTSKSTRKSKGTAHLEYTDGMYDGDIVDGERQGKGIMTYKNGDIYDGKWENDVRHGDGTLTTSKNIIYKGDWYEDDLEEGTVSFPNGDEYDGVLYYADFSFDNFGQLTYADGSYYNGHWKKGIKEGEGEMRYVNGDKYYGFWEKNKREGHGTMDYKNGDYYDGNWENDKKEGSGNMDYANGTQYYGTWINDAETISHSKNRKKKKRRAKADAAKYAAAVAAALTSSSKERAKKNHEIETNINKSKHAIITPDDINAYRTELLTIEPRYALLTYTEFISWFIPTSSPRGDKSWNDITNTMDIIELFFTSGVCRGGVNPNYIKRTLDNLIGKDQFDLIIALKTDYKIIRKSASPTVKLNKVCGFLIAEKGECKDLPNTYSINLICTREDTIKAYYLLGAFLSVIINSSDHSIDKKVVLELAGSFSNLEGFYSYSKVGFSANPLLYGPTCFDYRGNLPMEVDLTGITNHTLMRWITGQERAPTTDQSGLLRLQMVKDKTSPEYERQLKEQLKLASLWEQIFSDRNFTGTIYPKYVAHTDKLVDKINNGAP
jgi:hypothetical protein